MGPAAWAAVGRAILVAVANSALFGRNGALRLVADEVVAAIERHDIALAMALLQDLKRRHRNEFDAFLEKYRDQLPPELLEELGG